MLNLLRAFGTWVSRNVFGYAKQDSRPNKIYLSERDRLDIEKMIEEAETNLEIRAILKSIDLYDRHYRYPEDKDRLLLLCQRKSYQIDALRRGEYPVIGVDVAWESEVV